MGVKRQNESLREQQQTSKQTRNHTVANEHLKKQASQRRDCKLTVQLASKQSRNRALQIRNRRFLIRQLSRRFLLRCTLAIQLLFELRRKFALIGRRLRFRVQNGCFALGLHLIGKARQLRIESFAKLSHLARELLSLRVERGSQLRSLASVLLLERVHFTDKHICTKQTHKRNE